MTSPPPAVGNPDPGLLTRSILGLDVETTGLEHDSRLRTVQLSTLSGAWIFDVSDPVQRAVCIAILSDTDRRFVSHTNIDPRVIARCLGVDISGRCLDTWTLACLREPSQVASHALKSLSTNLDPGLLEAEAALTAEFKRLQGPKPPKPKRPAPSKSTKPERQALYLTKLAAYEGAIQAWEAAIAEWESYSGWRDIPTSNPVYRHYSGLDPIYALRLFYWLLDSLSDMGVPRGAILAEQRFYQICVSLSIRGMRVDTAYARDVALGDWEIQYETSRKEFEELTGFVSGSPRLADYLISRGVELREETDNGNPSLKKTAIEAALSRYLTAPRPDGWLTEWPAPEAVRAMELKERVAEASNYVTFTRNVLARVEADGRVHPVHKGLGAETGRMSVTDPAVQTVKGEVTRGIFIPYRPDEVLVSIDLSQIEPRVFAALSGDQTLIDIFTAGVDIYDRLTEMISGSPFTKRQRSGTKRTVLATLYVGGVGVIVTQLRQLDGIIMSETEVSRIRSQLRRYAPSMRDYAKELEREDPVWLDSGRFVPVPPDREWKNINSKIQGTARDILRDTCFRIQEAGYESTVINLIHDEAIFSLPCATLDRDIARLLECFEVPYLGLPVVAEVEIYTGGRWGHGREIWTPPDLQHQESE